VLKNWGREVGTLTPQKRGVKTSYKNIKKRFLLQFGSSQMENRQFLFPYAVLPYILRQQV